MIGTILLVIIILALLGGLPFGGRTMGYGTGYGGMGVGGIVLIIVIVLLVSGRI